jgi:tripartite-type tricarboxylate transporter receptor subunit TctC
MAGIDLMHIPYKGTAPAMTDLLGGQISLMFNSMPSVLPYTRTGRLKGIAVSSAKRSAAAPDIPTIAEGGLPGFEATSWFALYGSPGIPRDVQMRINAEALKVMALPDVKEKLATLGLDINTGTPEALTALMQAEISKWAKVVKESGAKPD